MLIFALIGQSGAIGGDNASNRLLRGPYSGIFSGVAVTSTFPQPFAGTGLFVSDGDGNLVGHETVSFNGHACDTRLKEHTLLPQTAPDRMPLNSSMAPLDAGPVRTLKASRWPTPAT
jgi:hypothetical protein